jgi:hypothetical protein
MSKAFLPLRVGEMTSSKLDWKTNEKLAVGKGATVQEFVATVGGDKLEIDVAPWGEGHLRIKRSGDRAHQRR